MKLLTRSEVHGMVGSLMFELGFPTPIQHGPAGRKWDDHEVKAWLKKTQRKLRRPIVLTPREILDGITQTRPAPGGETRPAE